MSVTKKKNRSADIGVPRRNNTQRILNAAEKIFAAYGLAGARVDDIAQLCDLPKANILYYFGSKEGLYRATLERLLAVWLADADQWIVAEHSPRVGLEGYIRAKMLFSRRKPATSRLFMHELLAGGDCVREFLHTTLRDFVLNKAKVFAHWQEQGLFAPIDPAHFLFLLWSTTQAYADMQVQFAAVLGRKNLIAEDFEKGVETLMQLVDSVCLQKGNAD